MHVQRSKEKKAKFRNSSDNGYLDWLLHQTDFPLRESNSILSVKGKGFTVEELFRNPFTDLVFEFYCKKDILLKVLIQIHQILKTCWKGYRSYTCFVTSAVL